MLLPTMSAATILSTVTGPTAWIYGPWPLVENPEFWRHDLASGQYWSTYKMGADWHVKRAPKGHTHARINSVRELKETLRGGAYAWPGGYPMYLVTADGGALHFACVRENYRWVVDAIADTNKYSNGWCVVGCKINEDDHDLTCDHCNKKIEASYEPDTDEDDG